MNKTYDAPEIKILKNRLDTFEKVEKIRTSKTP